MKRERKKKKKKKKKKKRRKGVGSLTKQSSFATARRFSISFLRVTRKEEEEGEVEEEEEEEEEREPYGNRGSTQYASTT
ncbi:hypothetical protein V1477_005124 [Vespula maculifrons]|uniref:Uncharacterized protein n=1 Tax=Vespula maculifrons TaxID=7453 RepID=A0ABD2CNR1_VESMC